MSAREAPPLRCVPRERSGSVCAFPTRGALARGARWRAAMTTHGRALCFRCPAGGKSSVPVPLSLQASLELGQRYNVFVNESATTTNRDLLRTMLGADRKSVGLGFSSGGFLLPYHMGVLKALRAEGIVHGASTARQMLS